MLGLSGLKRLLEGEAELTPGLTDDEFQDVAEKFGFDFNEDHRAFLALTLPIGERWPDWRDGETEDLRARLCWPIDSLLFDVREGAFWPTPWGARPADSEEAVWVAAVALSEVPRLVPVYGHRYAVAAPAPNGSPVFSAYQSDVIYYGKDLDDYLNREFGSRSHQTPPAGCIKVRFWSSLVEDCWEDDI